MAPLELELLDDELLEDELLEFDDEELELLLELDVELPDTSISSSILFA